MTAAHRMVLRLRLQDAAAAERARLALAPDNDGFLAVRVDGRMLVVEAAGSSPLGLLRTIEDALNCLRGAGLLA